MRVRTYHKQHFCKRFSFLIDMLLEINPKVISMVKKCVLQFCCLWILRSGSFIFLGGVYNEYTKN